ncbi:M17 family peptidase N-terminal domain-containing protein [Mucilaginibacter defluvii]|uniref:Peptidase M17 leucyl aminopeptidase N-terminal domain-containing protein n=1 Tax=Mucilaginibacter defluvii TaxID=1196019 RepID=A0ABP9FUQ9_9SPHI
MENKNKHSLQIGRSLMALALIFRTLTGMAQQTATAVGTSMTWGTVDGIRFTGLVQGPSSTTADLQVACVFEYTEGDIYTAPPALPASLNGLVHLDEALKGQLTEIRKTGRFDGRYLTTFYLDLPPGTIAGKKLLLIGLGDRARFDEAIMTGVGRVAAREALKLGVRNFALATDIKDAGISSKTALVQTNVAKGIVAEYRSQSSLRSRGLTKFQPLSEVFLLAGPAFFIDAGSGITAAIAELTQ